MGDQRRQRPPGPRHSRSLGTAGGNRTRTCVEKQLLDIRVELDLKNNGLAGSQVCDSAPGDLGQQRVVSTPPWGGEAGFPEGQLQGEDPRRSPQH